MRILVFDIETAPHIGAFWGLWDQNIATNQILAPGYTMCWSAKWLGEREVMFDSMFASTRRQMVKRMHALLSEADAVIHFNGTKFDVPMLNTEFLLHGLPPPPPYREIDLLRTVRSCFRFPSNKLDYISERIGMGRKVKHKGMPLWFECMNKSPSAWKVMEKYNRQDVKLTEDAYYVIRPWVRNHPVFGQYSREGCVCSKCGSKNVQRRGWNHTKGNRYPRYWCKDCYGWSQGPAVKGDRQPLLRAV